MEEEKNQFNFWLTLELIINFFVVITIVPFLVILKPEWLGFFIWVLFMIWGFKPLIFAIRDFVKYKKINKIKKEPEKIIKRLKELKKSLNNLKKQHRSKGEEKFDLYRDLLKRIIIRIYPEKDAKEIQEKLIHKSWIVNNETLGNDKYWQEVYIEKIDLSLRAIDTILEEYKLFNFDDFKPIKEKVETEAGIKTGFLNLGRKVTREK